MAIGEAKSIEGTADINDRMARRQSALDELAEVNMLTTKAAVAGRQADMCRSQKPRRSGVYKGFLGKDVQVSYDNVHASVLRAEELDGTAVDLKAQADGHLVIYEAIEVVNRADRVR